MDDYVLMKGFDKENQILIHHSIHDEFVNEINNIIVLSRFDDYEVKFNQETNLHNINLIKANNKYTISLSCMQKKLMMIYIFSIYKKFENSNIYIDVNVNSNKNMISGITPSGILNCLKFFRTFI